MAKTARRTSTKSISLSPGEVISASWKVVKRDYFALILLAVGIIVVSAISSAIVEAADSLGFLLNMILNTVMSVGVTKAVLDIAGGKGIDISIIWKEPRVLWNFFLASLIAGILIVIGLIFLIVPGIYLALRFSQLSYLVVDKRLGAKEAIRRSSELTEGVKWPLFVLFLSLFFFNVLGALVFVVGLLVTVPISVIAQVLVYQRLLARR